MGIDTTLPRIDLRMRVNGDRLRVGVRAWAQPEALPLTAVLDVDRARGNGEAWLGATRSISTPGRPCWRLAACACARARAS
ncbi:hypothetical protein AR276_13940 [Stenotrophomonas maltophilia]|nr:hypothetical protein AR276_13940 [Stenotrophomonas maltophilia]